MYEMKKTKKTVKITVFTIILSLVFSFAAFAEPVNIAAPGEDPMVSHYKQQFYKMFDAVEYATQYPEVAALYNYDPNLLFEHFLRYGVYADLRPENLVPGWSAKIFTEIIKSLIGGQPGLSAAELLAAYANNPANAGYVNRMEVIFDSYIRTGMPPMEVELPTTYVPAPAAASSSSSDSGASGDDNGNGGGGVVPVARTLRLSKCDMSILANLNIGALMTFIMDVPLFKYEDESLENDINIVVQNGGTLEVSTMFYTPGTPSTLTIENGGTVNLLPASEEDNPYTSGILALGGDITNNGTINVDGMMMITMNGDFVNNGVIYNNSDEATVGGRYGDMTNNGTIVNEGEIEFGDGDFTNNGTITNDGRMWLYNTEVANNGTIENTDGHIQLSNADLIQTGEAQITGVDYYIADAASSVPVSGNVLTDDITGTSDLLIIGTNSDYTP